MGVAEIIIVSLFPIVTLLKSPAAIRVSALIGSPCVPVETIRSSPSNRIFTLFDIDQYTFGYLELAYFNGGIDDLEHAPSRQGHFTAILYRQIDNLLQAVHVGRECRDNQPTIHVLRK